MSCSSSLVPRAPGRWSILAIACWMGGTACIRELEPDLSAPTPWEIQPASAVDDGTSYWPGTQWRTALPAQVEMDSAAMSTLSRDLRGHRWPTVRSLLIVRRGYLVLNEYLDGATPQELERLQSATTTVTGLLVGIAVREGKLRATDGIPQLFPEYADLLASGSSKNGMLVENLLTMRSGLAFYEEDAGFAPSLEGLTRSSGDWLRYIFSAYTTSPPGERWNYSSGDAIVLGGVLHAVTGEPANQYARHTLFAPLGISDYTWFIGQPNGLPQMGGGLSLTAPDMARLGYLLLRKGQWGVAPIVTPAWVASMSERRSIGVAKWRGYTLDFGRMLWELPPIPGTADFGVVAAAGVRGQWIIVVPSRDLVVVATGDAISVEDHARALQLLYDVILPAAR
jgi:CubicO group peptidase (beta-lactamase class C family)